MEAPSVHYAQTNDGYNIGYTVVGEGATVVYMPHSFLNLWRAHVSGSRWGQAYLPSRLASQLRLVQYNYRGQGFSTRGLGERHALQSYESDLEAVLDCLGPERVVLLASGISSHVAIRYAARHPERLRGMVLFSTGVTLRRSDALDQNLSTSDWDLFLHSFLNVVQANETINPEERRAAVAVMKTLETQADWLEYVRVTQHSSVEEELSHLQTPTLVLAMGGNLTMVRGDAERLASLIPGASLASIDESAALHTIAEPVVQFVESLPSQATSSNLANSDSMSKRELDVLRLVARGRSNRQIANELVITVSTVTKHVGSILGKTESANRTEAAAYAHRHGIA